MVVWEVGTASAVAQATAAEVMSGLAWRPDGNELAMVGANRCLQLPIRTPLHPPSPGS